MSDVNTWSRREFLVLATGAASSVLLAACSPTTETTTTIAAVPTTRSPAPGTTTQPPLTISNYWDLLREAQRRVRTSPDHLPAHMARLAREGDLEQLVTLIRDHVAVIPVDPSAWIANADGQRWGTRGVLRAGMGTPREIAQLLADTLEAAGTSAAVIQGTLQGSERPVLVNVEPLAFATPEAPDDLFALSGAAPVVPERVADPALAAAMAAAALRAVDPTSFRPPATADLFGVLPEVRIGDQTAGLWTARPGPFAVEGSPAELGEMASAPEARFTISIATTLDPRRPVEVATAAFRLDQLAGRRVDIAFVPPATSLADLIATRPADVTTVIPTIRVAGLDVTSEEEAQLVAQGDPFTLEGEVMAEDGERLALSRGTIGGSGDPLAAAEIRINRIVSSHYPRLSAEVDVLDAAGLTLEDLGALRFVVDDDGFEVPFTLRHNRRPPPRIVFIVDNSSSVPEQYRNAGATRVVTEIATAVKAEHSAAQFRVALVSASGAGSPFPWRDDPVRVGEDADQFTLGSALWQSYVDGAVPDANAIVFMTDGVSANELGEPQDVAPQELIAGLRSGPPAIMLGSGDFGPAFQGIADLSGGVALDIADQDEAIRAVLDQLNKTLMPYDMLVLADEDNAATERMLRVRLPEAGLEASMGFAVPSPAETKLGPSLAGIYLRIEANGVKVDRTLAGLPYRTEGEVGRELAQEVRQALFGGYSVITEAGAPSVSQVLDDAIAELLTWEPVFAAQNAEEALEALAATEDLPHGAFTFSVPVGGDGPLTWETGLRMWLSSERTVPAGEVDILRRSVDLLPVSRFVTTTVADPAESVRLTANRTATLAAFEAALYDGAAATRLTENLAELNIGNATDESRAAFRSLSNGWPGSWRLAFNDDLDAAVAADPVNGTLIAVLDDGTGGAVTEEEIKRGFKQAIALTELYGSAGFKVWASLEKAKLEKLRFATLVIHRMSIEGILETILEEACRKMKKTATAWATGAIGAADEEMAGLTTFYIDKAKEIKRFGDAIGLAPAVPTEVPVC